MALITDLSLKCSMEGFEEAAEKVNQLNALLKETATIIDSLTKNNTNLKINITTEFKHLDSYVDPNMKLCQKEFNEAQKKSNEVQKKLDAYYDEIQNTKA